MEANTSPSPLRESLEALSGRFFRFALFLWKTVCVGSQGVDTIPSSFHFDS